MLLGRFAVDDRIEYGAVHDGVVELLGAALPAPGAEGQDGRRVPLSEVRVLVPVQPTKILAIGRNYAEHAQEMGLELGAAPSVFLKPLQTLVADGGEVVLPPRDLSSHVEHEGEIAVVIGRRAHRIDPGDVHEYVLGLTCADDVSARDLQKSDPQITRGKGFDTFCPLGPYVQTTASIDEERSVTCSVNGVLRQSSTSASMIFSIRTIVAFLSAFTTLEPGDVILTGSPAGTGRLEPGDVVDVAVEGVGVLRHTVAADPADG
jgi:2-keto-4-pentenoate hydratase/2-oxohepta-3-ene-1,7-dioic acid hydratase in catechol pathway